MRVNKLGLMSMAFKVYTLTVCSQALGIIGYVWCTSNVKLKLPNLQGQGVTRGFQMEVHFGEFSLGEVKQFASVDTAERGADLELKSR